MKYTIALVEDEEDLNKLIQTYLKKAGYNVIPFFNGKDALNNINTKVHLWILDIMLPNNISGYDIIKEIRKNNEMMPVIFTSARDKDLDKIIGLELGSDDYITKPYSPKELVLRINNIINFLSNIITTLYTTIIFPITRHKYFSIIMKLFVFFIMI